MPINPVSDDNDISSALNIAHQSTGADPIQEKIGGLNQFLTGLDLEANTPHFNTGIGGAGMPSHILPNRPSNTGEDLFDYSRLQEIPNVPQINLERYVPARGVPARVQDVMANKDVRDKMLQTIYEGQQKGGANWYNADPLRDKFVETLGVDAGNRAFRKYMDMVAATSPRSDVGTNARNASFYYQKAMMGEPMPEVGTPNPQPYGHMAQRLHQLNAQRVSGEGWDALNNPKPASFVENLVGNQDPVTVDTHAFRLPAIHAADPRFLETAFQVNKDAPKQDIQKLVMSGEMPIGEALKRAAYWQTQPKANEYGAMEQYYKSLGREFGLSPAQTQASAWVGGGKLTGLASDESKPFLRFFQDRVYKTANELKMDPQDVMTRFIKGEMTLRASGGRTLANNAIDNALRLATGGRAHFGFGGDTESEGSRPEQGETGTVSAERSADSFQGDPRGNERGFADRSGQGSDAQAGAGLGADQPSSRGLNPRGDEGMMPDTSPGWSGISNARQKMLDDILNHTTQVETGSDPSAYNKKSGAFGAYQLMPKTALDVLGKSFPDLTTRPSVATQNPADVAMGMPFDPNPVSLTKEEQLREVTMNPDLQKQIAQSLTAQNMIALGPRFSSSGDVYTAHLLGAGDALKVLNSDPNTPLEQTGIDPRAIEANRLNGLTAGQLLARNESKMTAPIPGNEAVTVGGRGLVAGNDSINSGARILDAYSPDAISKAKAAASDQYTSVGNDWSKGSFKGDTANVAEKERLYNAGNPILGAGVANTVTGDSVESYAAKFGIDPSQVQSRITNMNGIPQVELYSKDLGEKFGEALGAISKDVGSMFGSKQNYDPLTGQYRPEMSSSVGRDTSDSGQVRGSDNRGAYYNPQIQEARNTAMGMFSRRTAPYMSELGAYNQQLPSVTGETAEQWAAANTGGDLSKVHGRIKYVNGAPMLEYFTQ